MLITEPPETTLAGDPMGSISREAKGYEGGAMRGGPYPVAAHCVPAEWRNTGLGSPGLSVLAKAQTNDRKVLVLKHTPTNSGGMCLFSSHLVVRSP